MHAIQVKCEVMEKKSQRAGEGRCQIVFHLKVLCVAWKRVGPLVRNPPSSSHEMYYC